MEAAPSAGRVFVVVSGDARLLTGTPDSLEAFLGELERREPGFRSGLVAGAADTLAVGAAAAPLLLRPAGDLVRLTPESMGLLKRLGMLPLGTG